MVWQRSNTYNDGIRFSGNRIKGNYLLAFQSFSNLFWVNMLACAPVSWVSIGYAALCRCKHYRLNCTTKTETKPPSCHGVSCWNTTLSLDRLHFKQKKKHRNTSKYMYHEGVRTTDHTEQNHGPPLLTLVGLLIFLWTGQEQISTHETHKKTHYLQIECVLL